MTLPLADSTYEELLNLYKKTKDKRSATYLNIILLKHKGYAQVEIADILNIDANTVCIWVKKYECSADISSYLSNNYVGYVGKLPYYLLGKVDNLIATNTFSDPKKLILAVKSQFGVSYSTSGATKLLKRLGFSHKEKIGLPAKMNVGEQLEFVKNYKNLESNLTDKSVILFMDAVHPQHNTHTGKSWLRKGIPTYRLTNTGRNRLNINGLYNPHTQEVIVTYHKTINAQATIELLNKLKANYPLKENLYIFADNAKYYVSTVLKEYLKLNPVIKLIHLPTYSPNLNLIERLWKFVKKELINPNYFEKFALFSTEIKNFFDNIHLLKEQVYKFIGNEFRLFLNLT